MSDQKRPRCEDCRFWSRKRICNGRYVDAETKDVVASYEKRFGECRRMAPSSSGEKKWPETRECDWCGEFQLEGVWVQVGL